MRKFIHFIALLMVAVFLPSTVLNAAPLVWCIAGDDHRAIEFGISDEWHGHGHHQHGETAHDDHLGPDHSDGHEHGCLDDQLIGPMVSNGAKVPAFAPVTVEPPVWLASDLSDRGAEPLLAKAIRPPPGGLFGPTSQAFLSTTKLLL